MNEIPNFKVVGKASESAKDLAKKQIHERRFNHVASFSADLQEKIERENVPKTERQKRLIKLVQQETNKLLELFGLSPQDIPEENYHIVSSEAFESGIPTSSHHGDAVMSFNRQAIIFRFDKIVNDLWFAVVAFHETLHLKGYFAQEVTEENNTTYSRPYRSGVSVESTFKEKRENGYHSHFDGLHEAIVSSAEKRFFKKMINTDEFKEEREYLYSEEIQSKIRDEKISSPDDIFWYQSEGGKTNRISYPRQRQVLDYVCQEISEEFPDKFKDTEEVFNLFLKAHFTGHLLEIGKLVEKTFGKYSFRTLGNMTTEDTTLVFEQLRRMRADLKYQKKKSGI